MQSTIEAINSWLSDIGTAIGEAVSLGEKNLVTLNYQDNVDITVEFDKEGEMLYLSAPVATTQNREREAFLMHILELNLFSYHTEGGALGYDERTDLAIYSKRYNPLSLDSSSFGKALERFIQKTVQFKEEFNDAQSNESAKIESSEEGESTPTVGGMMNPGFLKA